MVGLVKRIEEYSPLVRETLEHFTLLFQRNYPPENGCIRRGHFELRNSFHGDLYNAIFEYIKIGFTSTLNVGEEEINSLSKRIAGAVYDFMVSGTSPLLGSCDVEPGRKDNGYEKYYYINRAYGWRVTESKARKKFLRKMTNRLMQLLDGNSE